MSEDPKTQTAPEAPVTPIILDANSGQVVRLLSPDACFFVERATGQIDVVAKDRVSNLFRRDGENFKYFDRGADAPPKDAASYATIEQLEDLVQDVSDQAREAAATAIDEPESVTGPKTKHYSELDPPPADRK